MEENVQFVLWKKESKAKTLYMFLFSVDQVNDKNTISYLSLKQ